MSICVTLGGGPSVCVNNDGHLIISVYKDGKDTEVANLGVATMSKIANAGEAFKRLLIHAVDAP